MATGHLRVTAPAGFGRKHVAPHGPAFLAAQCGGADLLRSHRSRGRSGARGLRHGDTHRQRARPESRGGQAVAQPARGVRFARIPEAARCAAHAGGSRSAQLPRLQSAGRTARWLVLPRQGQAGDHSRAREPRLQRRGTAASLGCGGAAAWPGAPRGRFSRSWRAASWSPCSTSTHWRTTTSGPCIRSSATYRPRFGSSSSTSSRSTRRRGTGLLESACVLRGGHAESYTREMDADGTDAGVLA